VGLGEAENATREGVLEQAGAAAQHRQQHRDRPRFLRRLFARPSFSCRRLTSIVCFRPLPVGFAGGLNKLVRHRVSPSPLPRKVSPVARRTWRRGRRRVRSCSVWRINTVRRRSGIPLARRRPIVPESAMRRHPRGATTPRRP
ncbi:unnamed protein product, partial [Ixodes persulcatus]